MTFTYTTLSYKDKREYIIKLLLSFKNRGSTFATLAESIKNDESYPEDKIDYIEQRFAHYVTKTKDDKVEAYEKNLKREKPIEEATSDEELNEILSRL